MNLDKEVKKLNKDWSTNPRWKDIKRVYTPEDVLKHRISPKIEHTVAKNGAVRFWNDTHNPNIPYTVGLGTIGPMSVLQKVHAGFRGVFYVSGWQTAAGHNIDKKIYSDQSIYSPISQAINTEEIVNGQILGATLDSFKGISGRDWFLPIMVDAEAGFGGNVNASELMDKLIRAGASGIHFEDQDSTHKKCGHLGGKVIIPTQEFIAKLNAARQAADILDVPVMLMARTDAKGAGLLSNDVDENDRQFLTGDRVEEGLYVYKAGLQGAIERGLAYAPYADMLWYETSNPSLKDAQDFANAIFKKFPDKLLAYNCSPSFKWRNFFPDNEEGNKKLESFMKDLAKLGYKYPFITLFDFHVMNLAIFEQTQAFLERGMEAFCKLQDIGHSLRDTGYTATAHQQEVGIELWDHISESVSGGKSSTLALKGSTEEEQFQKT